MKGPKALETLFQALADRTRLRLLNLMADSEICVCFFVEVLGEPQPKISRHLAYLRRAGLVSARREAKWIHYALSLPTAEPARSIVVATLAALEHDRDMKRDRVVFAKTCCSPRLSGPLRYAPRPSLGR